MISIITAAYNCDAFISQTIKSVQAQTVGDWEMIIVDDCSTDKTLKIIKEHAELDSRIKYLVNHQNSGPAKTRNRGIELAAGKYLAFLDGDDIWLDSFIEVSLNFMQANSYPFVFSSYKS